MENLSNHVVLFSDDKVKPNKKHFGGKGSGLLEMTQAKLPVPPGFVIDIEICKEYQKNNKLPDGLMAIVKSKMKQLEKLTGKNFGKSDNPLLVSVRSGAAMSMPGMMDTILNLGLNQETIEGLIKATQNERFTYDAYRRFIEAFGSIAMGIDIKKFNRAMDDLKKKLKVKLDTELDANSLKDLAKTYKNIYLSELKENFPEDPYKQLELAIDAVFRSWMGKRAVDYRRLNKITPDMADGTAVNIVTMVFGNMGNDSGTGVAFTRDPGTGDNQFYGEFLMNAQGEDVVAGVRTPKPISELKDIMPSVYEQLNNIRLKLENHFREVQDMEFTVEKGKLYMLQTRNGKMNAQAAFKTSVDLVKEKLISKEEAVLRIKPEQLEQLLHRRLDPKAKYDIFAKGIGASPGAATGIAIFDSDTAEMMFEKEKKKVILVREETKPDDVHGFYAAQGILTSRGGKTSHAAVVARGIGKPCVVGAEEIHIDETNRKMTVGSKIISEGDVITVDGTHGNVILGEVPTIDPEMTEDIKTVLTWSDSFRKLGVRANADEPLRAKQARDFGAEGIGLCRTERMFEGPERLNIVHEMILAESKEEREKALQKLKPLQKSDFIELFKAMEGLTVTIRLLDPPLHEFLPKESELLTEIFELKSNKASEEEISEKERILRRVRQLFEVNPMLGLRGVRLGLTIPEIYEMQVNAIAEAMSEVTKENVEIYPEIMLPNVSHANEMRILREKLSKIVDNVLNKEGIQVKYRIGTMIETVRAAITSKSIAQYAEFFSFGTNDLTQGTFSFSREDAEAKFIPQYLDEKILPWNPFESIDQEGVGEVMKMAISGGRSTRSDLKIGICGEQGGEPQSVEFCHKIGLDYVSCSPFRIPIARLSAAQANLKEKKIH
ncbi:MAG: pyruvate, phosphate dikinase [Candidatus Thorarchaeota archaeon]